MSHYEIFYLGTDNKRYSEHYTAPNESSARNALSNDRPGLQILSIENVTLEDMAYQVAHKLLGILQHSKDQNAKTIGMLAKPVSAISVTLVQELKHYLVNEHNTSATGIAKKIYKHLMS